MGFYPLGYGPPPAAAEDPPDPADVRSGVEYTVGGVTHQGTLEPVRRVVVVQDEEG